MHDNEKIFRERIGVDFTWKDLDDLIVSDANILRPIIGYSFEFLIDEIFKKYFDIELEGGTGDSDIDRCYTNKYRKVTLQIKTPIKSSIKNQVSFSFSLHKTHGLEKRPQNLYPISFPCSINGCIHDGEQFPDYLIGKHPTDGVLIIPRDKISESKNYPGHFTDPLKIDWKTDFLNAWELLGFNRFSGQNLLRKPIKNNQSKFPQVSNLINLIDDEILNLFIKPENFRLLEMNLKGNMKEPFIKKVLDKHKIKIKEIEIPYPKYDIEIHNGVKIQIKGTSKSISNKNKNVIGTEVMGTHGKGSIRRYSLYDFDYLCIVIDPIYLPDNIKLSKKNYSFCFIKSSQLPLHPKNELWHTKDKLYENCKFEIFTESNKIFLKPSNNYRQKICFNFDKIEINNIPRELYSL